MTGVTEAEERSYRELQRRLARPFLRPAPAVLWHYTTGDALLGIINSGRLWATHISCLNDYSEMRYGMRLVRDAIDKVRALHASDTDVQHLMENALETLADEISIASQWYVSCLTEQRDDLSQWRAYGSGEGGYAIGFASSQLQAAPDCGFLVPVSYDHQAHEALARDVVAAMVAAFKNGLAQDADRAREPWARDFARSWDNAMTPFSPMLKDAAFESEREWRVIHSRTEADIAQMVYRQTSAMLTRHVPMAFPISQDLQARHLPIVEIMVGPCRHLATSVAGVSDLLRSRGYPADQVKVTGSRAPFQSS